MKGKGTWIVLVLVMLIGGCAVSEATLSGHDFLEAGLNNMETAVNEYHGNQQERIGDVQRQLAGAFVADARDAAGDDEQIAAVTAQFLLALNNLRGKEDIENTRYNNSLRSLSAMREVNSSLRSLGEIKLGWADDTIRYVDGIRSQITAGN